MHLRLVGSAVDTSMRSKWRMFWSKMNLFILSSRLRPSSYRVVIGLGATSGSAFHPVPDRELRRFDTINLADTSRRG